MFRRQLRLAVPLLCVDLFSYEIRKLHMQWRRRALIKLVHAKPSENEVKKNCQDTYLHVLTVCPKTAELKK